MNENTAAVLALWLAGGGWIITGWIGVQWLRTAARLADAQRELSECREKLKRVA